MARRIARIYMAACAVRIPGVFVYNKLYDVASVVVSPLRAPCIVLALYIANDTVDHLPVLFIKINTVTDLTVCRRAGDDVAAFDDSEPF